MPPAPPPQAIVYFGQYFPELRQTFVHDEIAGLRSRGLRVEVVAIKPGRSAVLQESAVLPEDRGEEPSPLYLPSARSPRFWLRVLAAFLRRPIASVRSVLRVARCRGELSGTAERGKLTGYALRGLVLARWIRTHPRLAGVVHLHAHFDEYPLFTVVVAAEHSHVSYSYTMHTVSDAVGLRQKAENAAFVASVSEYARRWLAERVPGLSTPVELVRCGIRREDWRVRRSPRDPPLILSVGALIEVKGHDDLLRAARTLADRGVGFELVIAGEGEGRAALEGLVARLRLGEVVWLRGAVSRDEVRQLLGQATVFALACRTCGLTDRDGIPVSLMEAMAAEVPVVSTRLSAIPELIEDGVSGRLVGSGSPEELADALQTLLADEPARRRLAVAGRERVAREFDLQRQVDCMHGLFVRAGVRGEEGERR